MKQIKLSNSDQVAFVDDEDYEKVNAFRWRLKKSGFNSYVARSKWIDGESHTVRLHRFIMDCPSNMEVHHKDGNPLNNQKNNLEICTKQKNLAMRGNYGN